MPIDVQLVDPATGNAAQVHADGRLFTGGPFNLIEFKELAEDDTAYNFYPPRQFQQFVVTRIFAYGDKEVAANANATVEVYEATSASTITVSRIIMQFEIGQNEFHAFDTLALLVNTNRFINAKTSDDDVHMNILGYYIADTGEEV